MALPCAYLRLLPLLALTGCLSGGAPVQLPQSRDTPLDSTGTVEAPRVARLQRGHEGDKPAAAEPEAPVVVAQAPPPEHGVVPVTATSKPPSGEYRATVRARVNGHPIFNEELMRVAAFDLMHANQMEEPASSAARARILKEYLQQLIDRELVLQDAYRKLNQNQRQKEKLLEAATKFANKRIAAERKKFPTDEVFQQALQMQHMTVDIYREHLKRDFVHREYLSSRIRTPMERIGHGEVREYFDQHQNEFQTLDRVEWQDVFIAVGQDAKHQTLADARRFAAGLVERARAGEDFAKFLGYDEGDSRFRKGMGQGQRKGEIKPAEVEAYIWNMRDGEIGPPVELSTGIHVFRLVKREYAGVMQFTPEVQTQILEKLRMEVFNREKKLILRDLESSAVITVEREPR